MTSDIPAGFAPSARSSNLLDLLGPLYEAGEGAGYRVGLRADQRHSNAKGMCHGAVLAMLADVYLGRLCALSEEARLRQETRINLVTSGLTLAYLSAAKSGDWLETVGQVDRIGRNTATSTGLVLANGKPVLRATGTFQVVPVR